MSTAQVPATNGRAVGVPSANGVAKRTVKVPAVIVGYHIKAVYLIVVSFLAVFFFMAWLLKLPSPSATPITIMGSSTGKGLPIQEFEPMRDVGPIPEWKKVITKKE